MAQSLPELKDAIIPAAIAAGKKIMEVYDRVPQASLKEDGSPVTEADEAAEAILIPALKSIAPDIPIISEENSDSHNIKAPNRFFLVDPLDGTREFLKRDGKGSFTVNIAMIEQGRPTLGIVFAPALDRLFTGTAVDGAYEKQSVITVRSLPATGPVAVASVSHREKQTDEWLSQNNIRETVSIGSSLKFCLLACGEADVYPRFGPTMEWDTAAGDAILRAAGGKVIHPNGETFEYGKSGYRNSAFIAHSGWMN